MITSKQRAQLKGLANQLDALFQVGKGGINDQLIRQVDETLECRELIKLRVLETSPESVKETASKVAEQVNAELVQVIGSIFVLYRESKDNKQIKLVK